MLEISGDISKYGQSGESVFSSPKKQHRDVSNTKYWASSGPYPMKLQISNSPLLHRLSGSQNTFDATLVNNAGVPALVENAPRSCGNKARIWCRRPGHAIFEYKIPQQGRSLVPPDPQTVTVKCSLDSGPAFIPNLVRHHECIIDDSSWTRGWNLWSTRGIDHARKLEQIPGMRLKGS